MTTAPLRVVLVDDHRIVRSGVRAELAGADAGDEGAGAELVVVGEAADVEGAVQVVTATRPDVVLLDVHLLSFAAAPSSPGGARAAGGVDVIARCTAPGGGPLLTDRGSPVRFLALSVSDAAADVIEVIRAGARGYVTKTIAGPELRAAVRRVADGDAVFSPRLAGFVLDSFGAAGAPAAPPGPDDAGQGVAAAEELDRLTAREQQVMRLIARGYAYKEVARELVISVRTVETHVSAVLRKLQLSSRHELTRWAAVRRIV